MANLIRRNENREVAPPRGDYLDPFRMMDALLRWDPFRSSGGSWFPQTTHFAPTFDVKETKDSYLVSADLPGVKESDIDVTVTGNVLTVSGRREQESQNEGEQYFTMERSWGSFSRSLSLPEGVDLEHVSADLKDGVLKLHIPKRPEVQPRKIAIGGGEGRVKA